MSTSTNPASFASGTISADHAPVFWTTLAARILEGLVQLAGAFSTNPAYLNYRDLHHLLAREHRERFNEDMAECLEMHTQYPFDLSPQVVATGILPHTAQFLANQIVRSLTTYSPHGVVKDLVVSVDCNGLAVADFTWLYSVVGSVSNMEDRT